MAKQPKPKAQQPKPKPKPKQGPPTHPVDKVFRAPGMAFAKGMSYIMNKSEAAGKALRAKIHEGTKPKPKSKGK